jgi:membrane-bound serine protease (ClpP class)
MLNFVFKGIMVVAAVVPTVGLAFLVVLGVRLVHHSRHAKRSAGVAGIVGMIGTAETGIAPDGWIFVRGELWNASSKLPVEPGQKVRIGVHGLVLMVEGDRGKTGMAGSERQSPWASADGPSS